MRILKAFLLAGAASVGLASGALAADPAVMAAAAPVAIPETVTSMAGYFEFFGAIDRDLNDVFQESDPILTPHRGIGGQARTSFALGTALTFQADGWYEYWRDSELNDDGGFWTDERAGIAAHIIRQTDSGFAFGAMLSLGQNRFYGDMTYTPAIEAAILREGFRLGVQAGYGIALGSYGAEYQPRNAYLQAVGTVYLGDSFALSANAGVTKYTELLYESYTFSELTWGARAEVQLGQFGVFAAYQGEHETWVNDGGTRTTHFVGVGISLTPQGLSIRERDAAVGFTDLNTLYGPTFHR